MTWFKKALDTIPSKSTEYQSATISRAEAKLNSDLNKRADLEEITGGKISAHTHAMKLYDYIQEILDGGEYIDEIISVDELSKVILGRQKSAEARTRVIGVTKTLLPAIVGVWSSRQFGRQFMILALDENNKKVVGVKLASNSQESDAYRARAQRRADIANGRTLRETEAFNALPENNPAKSLKAAVGI